MSANEAQQLGQFIPLHYHYQMLLDKARMSGFKNAIERAVPSGGTVVELGGGTGVLSFFAAQKAAQVFCVERNPQLAAAARKFLALNGCGDCVQVVEADAAEYAPPEPADVVVCEMLHSALLREKQIQIIEAFKRKYRQRYLAPAPLPTFIPEATILGVQGVSQDFNFLGYQAPLPVFFEPTIEQSLTKDLSAPQVYSSFEYRGELPKQFNRDLELEMIADGELNAFRFITKNILAVDLVRKETIDWHNFYLVVPSPVCRKVQSGQKVRLKFDYRAGGSLDELEASISVA